MESPPKATNIDDNWHWMGIWHLWQSSSGANILEVRGMEANAELSMLFSLNTNTLIAKNGKFYYENIYTNCIEKRHFLLKNWNFDPVERPLKHFIFQKYFTCVVFVPNGTTWGGVPIEIQNFEK